MCRVSVYIDGFNLFYGIRDKGWRRYYWIDVHLLSESLLLSHQTLEKVRYFTARINHNPRDRDKKKRQMTYLEAIETLPDVSVHYGAYKRKSMRCMACGETWRTHEEKMTDVNIAVELLGDAVDDAFDTAIIVSADGDLVGPIQAVLRRYPSKQVIVAFPPKRFANHLRQVATTSFVIGRKKLKDSQLPNQIIKPDGFVLTRPPEWR